MADSNLLAATLRSFSSRSALLDRLPSDLLRRLTAAVLDRNPPTFKDCFRRFRLNDHGVSFTSFYYYARRLRLHAHLVDVAALDLPPHQDLHAVLEKLIAMRLLEALGTENTTPRAILRLVDSYRKTVLTAAELTRRAAEDEKRRARAQARQSAELLDLAERLHHAGAGLNAPSQARTTDPDPDGVPPVPPIPEACER